MTSIAAIDLRESTAGAAERRRLAECVDRICREIGFLTVTGHGVDPGVIGRAWGAARDFFGSDPAKKRSVRPPHRRYPHGYFPPDFEALAGQSIAFFHQPNFDAEIVCIPSCLKAGESPRYPPVHSGPYLRERFRGATEVMKS